MKFDLWIPSALGAEVSGLYELGVVRSRTFLFVSSNIQMTNSFYRSIIELDNS